MSFRVFRELVRRGTPGLCITRVFPDVARERFGVENGQVLQLADTAAENVLRPTAIANLAKAIEDFVREHSDGCVVVIDGLEFLILRNGYDAILLFVEHLNELLVRTRAVVLIPVRPDTLGRKELARMERNLELADADAWNAEFDAREWSGRLDR